ncbi:hypothetical protein LTR36_008412 [Oleoguttula mirabilis]|uniref:C3H1-type domain-containing protein n=1 Tax=Oleoguttula mirabilis TaxID=1507867 RepID=A0AAV9J816_9PEZI|nr:hypothetical protein LTR36_008412 [Oleoguttula mirabilis]
MAHTNGSAHATTNGTSSKEHVASFWGRYEHLKSQDSMKNVLLEDVITRYENLVLKHNEYVMAHEEEDETLKAFHRREQTLMTSVNTLQNILNRDPFVLVLIDGDGMIFNNNFLRDGETGGRQAAAVLHDAVQKWSVEAVIETPPDVKVVVRVYANLGGLADVCTKAGLISSPNQLAEFARGFTRGKTLFDFVDVGAGKDRADGKIAETFKLYLYDYHCRQILFGCSHDNGYARLLEQYTDAEPLRRVTLLEGTPFEKELAILPFPTVKLGSIFRESKISVPGSVDLLTGQPPRPRIDSRGLSATSGVFTPRTNSPFSPGRGPIPQLDGQTTISQRLPHLRNNSIASSGNSSESASANSWATVAKTSSARLYSELPPTPTNSTSPPKSILRNLKGQRVDQTLEYDRDEVLRLKRLKMCNQHYIGNGCCHYNAGKPDKCPHRHDVKLSNQSRYTLRVVARETPCKKGFECDDAKCIYGHRCPFPLATEGSSRGSGMCLNGDNCRFPREMHGVDTKVVKRTLVTGAF